MNRIPFNTGIVGAVFVGEEERHHELVKKLSHKLCELLNEEFEAIRVSGDGWHPSEAAGCALAAAIEISCSMIDMMARHARTGIEKGQPAITEEEYKALSQELHEVAQKHIFKVTAHLHGDN